MLGDSLRRRFGSGDAAAGEKEGRRPPKPGPGGARRFTVWHWLLAALVILGGSFGVGYLLSTFVLFPRPDTARVGATVPSLYGAERAEAEARVREVGLEVGEVTELASMGTEQGRVLAQAPIPGQQLRPGAAVSFAVSGGPPELRVPPLMGMGPASARDLLESAGFAVEVQQTRSDEVPAGRVVRTEPEAGAARRLPAAVTLVVNAGPPDPDTLMADTVGERLRDTLGAPGAGAIR